MELGFSLPHATRAWHSITLHGPCTVHSFIQQAHPSPVTVPGILYDEEEPYRIKQPIPEGKLLLSSRSVMSDSFVTPWTVAHQAPLSRGFPRQEYWSGLPFPSPGGHPNSGIKPTSPPAWIGRFFTTEPPEKPVEFT